MEHNFVKVDDGANLKRTVIYQKDNNLDQLDNLNSLPEGPAVYAVCGRVNGEPANPRYIGEALNLREQVKNHFNKLISQPTPCFGEFMQSIKIKELVYELLPGASDEERKQKKEEWERVFKPSCTEVLNEVH
jgi:hypothetical protein